MDFHQTCMHIAILEVCFWIADGQISSVFDIVIGPLHDTGGYIFSRF